MKQSRIKRLIPRKLAKRFAEADDPTRRDLAATVERESAKEIAKMQAKGFSLVTRLDSGEGVFVRESDVVGLHIQIPSGLYHKLEEECRRRETTKRTVVTEALERALENQE